MTHASEHSDHRQRDHKHRDHRQRDHAPRHRSDPTGQPRIVVIGGGNAGTATAARLRRKGMTAVTVIEPKTVHTYRPLLNYAGAGLVDLADLQRPQSSVTPEGVGWIRDRAVAVDPDTRTVGLGNGRTVPYDQLVICPGSSPDWDRLPGSAEAMEGSHAGTTFLPEMVEPMWQSIRSLRSGRAVFAISDGPTPCGQTGQKVAYLACEHWQRQGVLDRIEVTLVTPATGITGIEKLDRELRPWVERYGIEVVDRARLGSVDAAERELRIHTDRGDRTLRYDLLHLVPPYAAPGWIAEAGLAGPDGHLDVDPRTLQHRRYPDIWGCGDAAAADCERSGGALRKQTPVVVDNLRAVVDGRPPTAEYDGYSVLPVTPGRGYAALAEFDRSGRLRSSFPGVAHTTPRRWLWVVDRHLLPQVYWRKILRGR